MTISMLNQHTLLQNLIQQHYTLPAKFNFNGTGFMSIHYTLTIVDWSNGVVQFNLMLSGLD
jgi:hypothetical protein